MRKVRVINSWDEIPVIFDLIYAARLVGANPESLRQRCKAGTFPGYKEGNHWRVCKDDFIAYMNERKNTWQPQAEGNAS